MVMSYSQVHSHKHCQAEISIIGLVGLNTRLGPNVSYLMDLRIQIKTFNLGKPVDFRYTESLIPEL